VADESSANNADGADARRRVVPDDRSDGFHTIAAAIVTASGRI
jgi:hypothetical protein